jgi:hypothetical protein
MRAVSAPATPGADNRELAAWKQVAADTAVDGTAADVDWEKIGVGHVRR